VHRLVLSNFNPCQLNKQANHKDGNKLNNNLDNLEWVTPKENCHHSYANGTSKIRFGEQVGTSKLNLKQVNEIRELLKEGKNSQRAIARLFGVSFSNVSCIKLSQTWTKSQTQSTRH
jgi:hypothetical protein